MFFVFIGALVSAAIADDPTEFVLVVEGNSAGTSITAADAYIASVYLLGCVGGEQEVVIDDNVDLEEGLVIDLGSCDADGLRVEADELDVTGSDTGGSFSEGWTDAVWTLSITPPKDDPYKVISTDPDLVMRAIFGGNPPN